MSCLSDCCASRPVTLIDDTNRRRLTFPSNKYHHDHKQKNIWAGMYCIRGVILSIWSRLLYSVMVGKPHNRIQMCNISIILMNMYEEQKQKMPLGVLFSKIPLGILIYNGKLILCILGELSSV